jgi:hypothetical protein
LNFQYAAEEIVKSKGTKVWCLGTDDTVKAAGHRRHDIKTGHITINGPDAKRETLSVGIQPNISHAGKDAAISVMTTVSKLAVVCGVKEEFMLSCIDFFMTDRAGKKNLKFNFEFEIWSKLG